MPFSVYLTFSQPILLGVGAAVNIVTMDHEQMFSIWFDYIFLQPASEHLENLIEVYRWKSEESEWCYLKGNRHFCGLFGCERVRKKNTSLKSNRAKQSTL